VRLVLPLALLLILLPPASEGPERVHLGVRGVLEQLAVRARVEEPVPVLLGHVRDEPGQLLAVEDDLVADARLDQPVGVHEVAVELETGIVEHKVDAPAADLGDVVGKSVEVVTEDILLGRGEGVTAR
jgi:hypothetical protein